MVLKANERHVGVEEYFEGEKSAEYKSEYYHGAVFSMAGGTPNHNRIALNMAGKLNSLFRGGPCEAFMGDLRVQISEKRHYAYPDIQAVCGDLKLVEGRSDTIVNPIAIIEVLSDSTKDYDRGSKFTAYRNIETLLDYILVSQDTVHIEHFSKEGDGTWRLREYFGIGETVKIKSVQAEIPMNDIYERVVFPEKTKLKSCP